MHQLNSRLISAQECESTVTIDHHEATFSVYTTAKRVATMLQEQFPSYYTLAADGASAIVECVPVSQLCRLHLSKFKSY